MTEYGSIEIVRGVGQNSVSEGTAFGPVDFIDGYDISSLVKDHTGATLGNERAWSDSENIPPELVGQWSGTDKDGKQATIRVWRLAPG